MACESYYKVSKTASRNFDKTYPDMDLIKLKSFYFGRWFTDKD